MGLLFKLMMSTVACLIYTSQCVVDRCISAIQKRRKCQTHPHIREWGFIPGNQQSSSILLFIMFIVGLCLSILKYANCN